MACLEAGDLGGQTPCHLRRARRPLVQRPGPGRGLSLQQRFPPSGRILPLRFGRSL